MNVKQLREKLGLTQAQMAQRVHVTVTTISRWESGRASPSPLAQEHLERLSTEMEDG